MGASSCTIRNIACTRGCVVARERCRGSGVAEVLIGWRGWRRRTRTQDEVMMEAVEVMEAEGKRRDEVMME